MKKLFTSESVTEGHPDKVADYIADSILDAALSEDPYSRVACEVAVTTDYCLVFGEITTNAKLNYEKIVREAVKEIGFDKDEYGFNANSIKIDIKIHEQSGDIALGVDKDGAGDQGIMFGYAINETEELMPLAISLSNKIAKRLAYVRHHNIIKGIRPDGKCQVTVLYDENNKPVHIDTVVLSTQHDPDIELNDLIKELHKHVFSVTLPQELVTLETKYLVNPTGRFVIGGPNGDSGLTGRKLVVDTYGGYAKNGGGALSGKDATKVDRSAAYMARYIAKNIVASEIASECEIQFAYAIGVKQPVSLYINTFNTGLVSDEIITKTVLDNFDLSPKGIIESLGLRKPIYKQTSAYGHFGKPNLPWEKLDKIEIFKSLK